MIYDTKVYETTIKMSEMITDIMKHYLTANRLISIKTVITDIGEWIIINTFLYFGAMFLHTVRTHSVETTWF